MGIWILRCTQSFVNHYFQQVVSPQTGRHCILGFTLYSLYYHSFHVYCRMNFTLSYFVLQFQVQNGFQKRGIPVYLDLCAVYSLIIGLSMWIAMGMHPEKAFRDALFQVVSVISTTGFYIRLPELDLDPRHPHLHADVFWRIGQGPPGVA